MQTTVSMECETKETVSVPSYSGASVIRLQFTQDYNFCCILQIVY